MRSINGTGSALISLVLLSLLVGCTTSSVKRAEPIQVQLPDPEPNKRLYSEPIKLQYQQAIGQLRGGHTAQAEQQLEQLLLQQPEIPGAWYNLALIQYHQQRTDQAQQSLARCLALNPRHPAAHTLNGLMLRQQGQFELARLSYAKALKSDPDYAQAHLNLAILYDIYLQYFEDAQHHYLRFLELATDDPQTEQVKLWLQDLQLRLNQESNG